MRILAVCGSLQARSSNLALLRSAVTHAPFGVGVAIFDGIRHLPHFDSDLEKDGEAPTPVTTWRRELAASDGLLIASPEYGHSLPGALKNAIDWVIGSGELHEKPVAVTASTLLAERGTLGLAALIATLGAVNAKVVGGAPIVRGADFDVQVQRLLEALAAQVNAGER